MLEGGHAGCEPDTLPAEHHFRAYLQRLIDAGKSVSWVRSQFSHLNVTTKSKYGFSLKEWPEIVNMVKGTVPTKKDAPDSDDEGKPSVIRQVQFILCLQFASLLITNIYYNVFLERTISRLGIDSFKSRDVTAP